MNFEGAFNAALVKYANQIVYDPGNDPLVLKRSS